MSGAIMPAPLAMPLIVTLALPIFAGRGRDFRKRVGGHDRLGGSEEIARPSRARPSLPSRRRNLAPSAVRRSRRWRRGRHRRVCSRSARAAICAVNLQASRPLLPVKALALPELTTSARALPGFSCGAAPFDRRRRAFRAGEDAGDGRAWIEQRQQHIGAVGIADAGCGGGEPHAGDRRHVGNVCRGEGGNGGGHRALIRRHARPCAGHPRLRSIGIKDADGISNSGLPELRNKLFTSPQARP